jgi:phospholipid-translocating ATPase
MLLIFSWTSITWVVGIGSSLVMLLWIVIYSFLPVNTFFSNTDGFIDEVEILFSNVTFWTTIVFSVLVALGESKWCSCRLVLTSNRLAPRFLIKFFKSTYMPLDKDIVREMWVGGDLKDRLGIRHRKESKNKHLDLETAPMFREPHARSASELVLQQAYEPTVPRSPADSDSKSPDDNGADAIELVPRTALPNPHHAEDTVSPNTSYYSASDIPLPSPIPPSLYQYSSREISQPPFTAPSSSRSLSPEPPAPIFAYTRPSHDRTQSPSRLQTPPHPHSLAPGQQPLVQLQPEGLHGYDAGEGRYRPEESDQNQADSSLAWDEPRAL